MTCCQPSTQKWIIFMISFVSLTLGIITVICWESIYYKILNDELTLRDSETQEYKMWKETPIPMFIEFYLFNFTNYKEVENDWNIKPKFTECGPYTYSEHHIREEVQFNSNNTITFKTKRIWKYLPEKSSGSPDDNITTINVILATVGYLVRDKHKIVQLGVNFLLEEKHISFTVTKTVKQFLFDGYDDPMLELVHKLNITGLNVPFDKFAWFYGRNGSADYDGIFTMFTGVGDLNQLGRLSLWNGENRTTNYRDTCGMVNGTSGELWYPVKNDSSAMIFSSDTCSTLHVTKSGTFTKHGIEGTKFIGDDRVFDNGTKYSEMSCFSPGQAMASGVRNVSQCKFGAPAFVSFPHFYLADRKYIDEVDGMEPNRSKHEFSMSIEPNTGVPLKVQAAMQINILLPRIEKIKLLKDVKPICMPMFWFRQTAELSPELAYQAKILLLLPSVGHYTGYGIIGLGCLVLFIGLFITVKDGWKGSDQQQLLGQQAL